MAVVQTTKAHLMRFSIVMLVPKEADTLLLASVRLATIFLTSSIFRLNSNFTAQRENIKWEEEHQLTDKLELIVFGIITDEDEPD